MTDLSADAGPIDPATGPPDEDVFLRRYLMRAPVQLPGRPARALTELARQHFQAARTRKPGQTVVWIADLDGEGTSIDLVTEDAPYLVDSTRAELERTGHVIEHFLHPQIVVCRDADGVIVQVLDLEDTAEVPEGANAESWMHIETTLIPDSEHDRVAADLRRVITDVHNAVADAPEEYRLIRELADRIEADPGEFDRDTSCEAGELLRWLADGNFMILGHAAYSANELTNPSRSSTATSNERGVLRGAASISPLELLPAYRVRRAAGDLQVPDGLDRAPLEPL